MPPQAVDKQFKHSGKEYTAAICLGQSVVGKELSPAACDGRILSMILLLKKLTKEHKYKWSMHIVAENQQDQTVKISEGLHEEESDYTQETLYRPDFIDSPQIVA